MKTITPSKEHTSKDQVLNLAKIYNNNWSALERLAYKFSKEFAEDIVQETFLKLLENPTLINWDNNVLSYIKTAVVNRAINAYWRNKNRKTTNDFSLHENLPNPNCDDTEYKIEEAEKYAAFNEQINQLNDMEKEIIILKFLNEKSSKEIAAILNLSISNVDTITCRAKKELKLLLSKNSEK